MFEQYNNTICVQVGSMLENNIISKVNYDYLKNKGRIVQMRRACYAVPALVEWDSLPKRFKDKIIPIAGNPREKKQKIVAFFDYLINDETIRIQLKNYLNAYGKHLTEASIERYYSQAIVFNAITKLIENHTNRQRALGKKDVAFWKNISEIVNSLDSNLYPHALPKHHRRLKSKYMKYVNEGLDSLVHAGTGNTNTIKLTGDAKIWILSTWAGGSVVMPSVAMLLKAYNEKAKQTGWKPLKSEVTIQNYLEEVKHLWYGARYGEKKSKEKFTYHLSTQLPTMRDSLWYSDGTKLNFYYQDEDGKICTTSVYEVIDAYSEVFLGYHISKTENYEAQFFAYKMAIQRSGNRPYQITYDNQGGHKKLENNNFLNKIARIAIKTQPYNGKSKTIESVFGRFQKQFMKQRWFYTGGNINTKSIESRANIERILANKHELPTYEVMCEEYRICREEWNQSIHYATGKPRIEMYNESINDKAKPLSIIDMIDLFWIERPKQVTVTPGGIMFKDGTEKKYYTKYLHDDITPDLQWLNKNIDKKFTIKLDPADESLIYLYEETQQGKVFVTEMTPKIFVHRGKQEQTSEDLAHINAVMLANKQQRVLNRDQMEAIQEVQGNSLEQNGLNSPAIAGIETGKNKRKVIPDVYKRQSNVTELELVEVEEYSEAETRNLYI